jgi:hypothetical protein
METYVKKLLMNSSYFRPTITISGFVIQQWQGIKKIVKNYHIFTEHFVTEEWNNTIPSVAETRCPNSLPIWLL